MNTSALILARTACALALTTLTGGAATLVINTDNATWRAIAPYGDQRGSGTGSVRDFSLAWQNAHPGWNTNYSPLFDDSNWQAPSLRGTDPTDPFPELNLTHVWTDPTNSPAFFRRTFFIPGSPIVGRADEVMLNSGEVWVNGNLLFTHCVTCSGSSLNAAYLINGEVGSQYLRPGFNVIAVAAHDDYGFAQPRSPYLALRLTIDYSPSPLEIMPTASADGLTLRWPEAATNVVAEATTNLTPPITWEPVTNQVVQADGVFSVTVPFDRPMRFFRLRDEQP